MGKPRWSWSTFAIKAILKLLRHSGISRGWGSTAEPLPPGQLVGVGWLLWHTTTARDRYRAYRRARRQADGGAVVLCDRFPLSQLESMDGPRGERSPGASRSRLSRLLTRLERRYYAAIGLPDLLLILRVEPDVALRRRPEDPECRVRQRAQEVLEVDWSETGAHVLDANRPIADLHRELESWIRTQL
jgi:thymidylate kinase